jgi:hypothetical protein
MTTRIRLGTDSPFAQAVDFGSNVAAGRVLAAVAVPGGFDLQWIDLPSSELAPAINHFVNVQIGGNDVTGDGTQARPFATLNRACTLVRSFGNASDTNRYCVLVGPGLFTENLVLSDFTWIIGASLEATRVTFTTFAFGAEWTPNVVHRGGLQSMTIMGTPTVSFAAVASQQGRLSFVNTWVNASWTFVGFNALNQVIFANSRLSGWTQTGIEQFYLFSCTDSGANNAVLNAGGGLNATAFLQGSIIGGALTANAPGAEFANLAIYDSQVVGMLTLNGLNAGVTVDTSPRFFRGGVTLAGGAPDPRYILTGAKAGNAALTSVCTQLAATGGFLDSTT